MNQQQEGYFFKVLTELEKTVSEADINSFKKLYRSIDYITGIQTTLKDYYDNTENPIKSTNLVILACKHNKKDILEYLFHSDCKILKKLYFDIGRNILPDDEDESCHNAIYYAIRSCNIDLLDTLISKWPGDYFTIHLDRLDEILSKAYEELELKNVLLSNEMKIFVENKLINLRFFSDTSGQDYNVKEFLSNIKERIELILQNISILMTNYSNTEGVDEKFLFLAKFIAQNIYVLKRQLRSTYDRLPWEEIEFCLISYISSHTKRQEINLFYNAVLNKRKILNHLENFAKKLEDEKCCLECDKSAKFTNLPNLKREKVIAKIISNYPQFEELYNDYQEIRDIHSLEKIRNYLRLALSSDPKEKEGQLIITRVLQIVGEYLKNTLESPKLSSTTSELLLLTLPKNTREVVIDLRNSLSHAYSFSKRTEIEENANTGFFIGVQNDTKRIYDVITDILYNIKIKTIRTLLQKMCDSESLEEIKEVTEIFNNAELSKMISETFRMMGHEKLKKLIQELSSIVTDKTKYEINLFDRVSNIIDCAEVGSKNIEMDFIEGFAILKTMSIDFTVNKIDQKVITAMKLNARLRLESIAPKIKPHNLKKIAELSMEISHSVKSRMPHNLDDIKRLTYEIFFIAQLGMDIKWIEELKEKLNQKSFFTPAQKQKKTCEVINKKNNNHLARKLSDLKNILSDNTSSVCTVEKLLLDKSDNKLQAVLEMLVLDIMSILSSCHVLENNLLFLDDNTPLLTGKCLRNHLAHGNDLFDVLTDPPIALILNAKKLSEENIMESKKKLGKLVIDDPFKLREKYDKDLFIITNQERMFVALAEGNLESVNDCLKKGADINARSIGLWTTLHFAAKGPSLEVIKFILDKKLDVNARDIDGQSPLHIAAAYGRSNIVEFFVKKMGLNINDTNKNGKTPLCIAAQNGHKDTVKVLLKNKASIVTSTQSFIAFPPLYYAIMNSHIDVAKILLMEDINMGINESIGGFTALHGAAENGQLELVHFLLHNKANVNAGNDRNWTPLHAAAFNGYSEIVNALISEGADVNARVINGCTPLHYAAESGHETIANILINHGANVNALGKSIHNTPLHTAITHGCGGIVKALLKNKADACAATCTGMTPLHLAAQSGNIEICIALLEHGVDICAKDDNNATPLYYAVENGHKKVVELLIKHQADINTKISNDLTLLHIAASKGHADIVEILIKNKARVDNRDIRGCTPLLHAASFEGRNDIIDLLIKNKAEVDTRSHDGISPLYAAALNGHKDAVIALIGSRAKINTKAKYNLTPLHAAVIGSHKDIVELLIRNKAQIDVKSEYSTPLDIAVEAGNKEIVEILIAHGANVNVKCNNLTPLLSAIKYNNKEVVEVLIANGASLSVGDNNPILLAVIAGYKDIVEILLKNETCINKKYEDVTLLHVATQKGHREIVKTLIRKGANVNATTSYNKTPLYLAAQEGHEDVVKILIANGANVNAMNLEGASLHIAAGHGYENIVKVLLDNGAKIDLKDNEGRTSLELAVAYGHLQVVKILLHFKKGNMNAKGNDDWTILHIASQGSNLEMVKYLVDGGCDINAKISSGSKPVHIAAREGYKETVEYFLSKGSSICEPGESNQTLLHYAAMKGHLEIVNCLITKGADINSQDVNGLTPMHIAASLNHRDVINVLLRNGATYNAVDKSGMTPLKLAKDKNVINLFISTEKLFEAVKCNSPLEVEKCIKSGAGVNALNINRVSPLHYAACKGYNEVVNILLQNKAYPNLFGNKGATPLHYAAKFSHFNVVKTLLSNGAVYNAVSDSGKTPLDFVKDKNIADLFNLLNESFTNVKNGQSKVINDLNQIKDIDTIKSIMNTRDRDNKTLIVIAAQNNFSNIEQLKQISQGDVSSQINEAAMLCGQGDYQRALSMFRNAFEKRKEILGPDNPGTLDVQIYIAKTLYAQGVYREALKTYEEIFQKQKEILGINNKDTLSTRSTIAFILHRQGKNEEAYNIFQEVYPKQKEILGSNHSDTSDTQFHMALVLERLGKYEEALNINKTIFEFKKKKLGANNQEVVCAQNNIALVLSSQGKFEEALEIYKEVLKRKRKALGINHADTLRTLHNIAGVLFKQKKYNESLKAFEEVSNIQRNVLGPIHPDTLDTQYNIANVLFAQCKWTGAFKAFRECFDQMKAVFGPNHPSFLHIKQKMKVINTMLKMSGLSESTIIQHLQTDINIAASNGDIQAVQLLLKNGADINDKDIEGRTPLHFAVSNGHIGVVNILLNNGADITQVTKKGNTVLHIASSRNYKEILEISLQHVSQDKLNKFINAKTISSGATSLHVATKNGYLDIAKSLLKRGVIYNIKNNEGRTPLDISKNYDVDKLLKLVGELFEDAKNGAIEMISKLKAVKPDEFMGVTNARDNLGNTLLQVTIANGHKIVASEFLEILKRPSQN